LLLVLPDKEAQHRKDKECIAAMKHAMHFISLAMKANPIDEFSRLVQESKEKQPVSRGANGERH